VVTNLIQPEAPLAIEPGRPISPSAGSPDNQGSFATALHSAVNSNSPAKTNSPARSETPLKLSDGENSARSLQQMLGPLNVPLAPALSVPAPKVKSPEPPFSPLPGKIGKRDATQTAASEPSTTNDARRQPPPFPLIFPVPDHGTTGDALSVTPPVSVAPAPGLPPGTPNGFTNAADPLMRLAQMAELAPPIPIVATALSGSDLQFRGLSAAELLVDRSATQPPTPDSSALTATPTKVAVGSPADPAQITPEQAAAFLLSPDTGTVTSATTPQPPASLPVASKPPRVLDTEARRVGSLPLRDLTAIASMFPQASRMMVPPAQLQTGAAALTSPVLDFAKGAQGSHLSPSPDHNAVTGKAPVPDSPDLATPPATSAPGSPALQRQIDVQPDNLPTASPLVNPAATGQTPGSQAPATNAAELSAPHPIPTSTEAAAGGAASVETARVVQGVAQSEMHIGFRSPAFGSVEVHTAVRDTQLGLAVSSERGDLRGFLAQEVPGLQTVFHQQGLQFDQIRFMAPGSGTGTGFSGGSNSSSPENGRSPRSWFSQDAAPAPDTATSEIQISTTRLSVHA
jgi:hypothetical protein